MKKIQNIIYIFLCLCSFAQAQSLVSGVVEDESGLALIGVNIYEEGTENGVITDVEGKYSITVSDNATLVFSYLGYKTEEIPVDGQREISLRMTTDSEQLDEVVVIGYGSIKRDEITSSISTVKGEELNTFSASNPSEALQGKAAGVQVLSSGGAPGASPQILIRGITTNNGTQPLIVLDGVMLPNGTSLNFLNPADIEDFQILKDASASAIYGSRASNGVVLVNTKRGKSGRATVNIDASRGVQTLQKIQMAGAEEYIKVVNQRRTNDGNAELYDPADFSTNTDWWDATVEDFAPITNINISSTGGSDAVRYAGSASYFDQQSNFSKGWYKKVTGRFNVDFKLSNKVKLQQDISPRVETWESGPGSIYNILRVDPLTEIYLPQDERIGRNIYSIYAPTQNNTGNPVGGIDRIFNKNFFFGLFSNTQLTYDITPALSISSQLGLNTSNQRSDNFNPEYFTTPNQQREINDVSRSTTDNFDYVLNNTISYKKQLGGHYLNLLGGVLWDSQRFNNLYGYRQDVPSAENENLRYLSAATGEGMAVSGTEAIDNIFSTIGRVGYNYNSKYYLTSSVRIDESSRFAKDNRRGIFPSVSVAWDIDSEPFFNSSIINNFRLKAGYGSVGNQNINRNGQFFAIGSQNYVFNSERVVTNFLSQFGNPLLQWETVVDQNIGLTTSWFNYKLDFSVEYYQKESRDLLFNVELPNYTGIPGLVAQNVGSFVSNGLDFQLGYSNNSTGDFNYSIDLNLSTNQSSVQTLAPGNEQLLGQKREDLGNRFLKISEVGQTVGLFYGFETDGLFQSQTEINAHSSEEGVLVQPLAQPGDLKFIDQNGDGLLNDMDLTVIGNPFPEFYGGLSANVQYKSIDVSAQFYGTYGNEVFNYPKTFLYSGVQDVNVIEGAFDNVWTPENTDAEFPRLTQNDRNGNYQRPSQLFIEDASYLRLRNLQIGYNLSSRYFQKLRIYVSGQNLFTWTNYSGFDPEVGAGGNIINDYGVDYARYPVSRTFLIGLNFSI